jgi:hypothetical protein
MSVSEMFWSEDPLPMPSVSVQSTDSARRAASSLTTRQRRDRLSDRRKATYRWERLTRVVQRVATHKCRCKRGRRCVSCYAKDVIAAERAYRNERV